MEARNGLEGPGGASRAHLEEEDRDGAQPRPSHPCTVGERTREQNKCQEYEGGVPQEDG